VIVIYDSFVNQIEEELLLRDHIRPLKTLFDCIETRVSDKDFRMYSESCDFQASPYRSPYRTVTSG
jgi:hypothetical protein